MDEKESKKVIEEAIKLEPLTQPLPEQPSEPVEHEVHFQYGDRVRLTVPSLMKFFGHNNTFRVCAYSAFGQKADQVSYEIVLEDFLAKYSHEFDAPLKETRINVLASEIEKIKE